MQQFLVQAAFKANLNFNSEEHKYEPPTKKILDMNHLAKWQSSATAMDLTMFIIDCQNAVKTTKMSETPITPKIKPMIDWLDKLEKWLDEVPPVDQPMRFGNKAFRTWMDKIKDSLNEDLTAILSATNPEFTVAHKAVPELRVYLEESFGSYERIDYGTGHELNFFVFLYCMCKIGVYEVDDFKPLINKVFQRYMTLMRKLQM